MKAEYVSVDQQLGVTYFDTAELARYELSVRGGLIYDALGAVFDSSAAVAMHGPAGRAMFVMTAEGVLYGTNTQALSRIHHSSFLAGRDVAAAGQVQVVGGKITAVDNISGHYLPPAWTLDQLKDLLASSGVDVGTIVFTTY